MENRIATVSPCRQPLGFYWILHFPTCKWQKTTNTNSCQPPHLSCYCFVIFFVVGHPKMSLKPSMMASFTKDLQEVTMINCQAKGVLPKNAWQILELFVDWKLHDMFMSCFIGFCCCHCRFLKF